tara:strand:+ start:434 stop:1060 length:627 start_codon:yes stop_codon:yes gene_type:complete
MIIRALTQGSADRLCGIYAIINSLTRVVGRFTRDEQEWIFSYLIDRMFKNRPKEQRKFSPGVMLTCGIRTRRLPKLLAACIGTNGVKLHKHCKGHLSDAHRDILKKVGSAKHTINGSPSESSHFEPIEDFFRNHPRGVIIFRWINKKSDLDHWTVCTGLSKTFFSLFDSIDRKKIYRKNVTFLMRERDAAGASDFILISSINYVFRSE